MDSIGSDVPEMHVPDIMSEFNEITQYRDDRYEVSLLWKECATDKLKDNKLQGRKMLSVLSQNLSKTLYFSQVYNDFFYSLTQTIHAQVQ